MLVAFVGLYVVLGVDPARVTTHIVQFRDIGANGMLVSGPISELRLFALYALVQYVFGVLLSIRLYLHRRHLAVVLLGLTTLTLVLSFVVSEKLITKT